MKLHRILLFSIMLLPHGVVFAREAKPLVLAKSGKAQATIVLAEKPTASAQLAAFELQHYLQKISGAKLSIVREPQAVTGTVILVGESSTAQKLGYTNDTFAQQEYAIKTFPNALLLMGYDHPLFAEINYAEFNSIYGAVYDPIGTCCAVYDFLENTLGVRWYYPNEEIGEFIPASATIAVKGLNIRRKPDAPNRPIYPLYSNTEQLYFTDWDQPKKFQGSWVNARTSLLYWIRHKFWGGGLRYIGTHAFDGYGAAFGESHPDWFSTKSYAKMKQLNYQSEIQPCLSAPGFFEEVVQVARDYFDGKPEPFPGAYRGAEGNFFSVAGMNDNTNMCGCPLCRPQYRNDVGPGGDASNYVWGFANRVAREVRKTNPNAMISGLAYFNYTLPPKGLVFEPNVAVTFCKFYEGYSDKNYQERDYQRISEYVNENKAKFFATWDYLLHPWMTEWAFPCLVPHVHANDVRRLGAIGNFLGGFNQFLYITCYSGDNPGGVAWASPVLDFMNMYWRMKLYDNFNFDIDKGLDEYYQEFFGPGAPGMKKFYTAMEDRWMELGGGGESRSWWGKLGTPEFLKEVTGYIQQAIKATAEGSIYRKRVELIDTGILQHMVKARTRYEGSAMSEFAPIGTAAVAHTNTSVTPDNWADDATWANSLPNEIQKTIDNEPVPQKTVLKLAYDNNYLYIQARCLEPKVSQMKATIREKDVGGFSDDSIELFVDPSGKGETYYQFCINSLGAVYDAWENPKAVGATATITWDSGLKVKTATDKDYWEMRAALPFANLVKKTPQPGSTWRFNLCRNRWTEQDKPPFSGWSATLGGFRNPERFGIITFNASEDRGKTLWNCDFESSAFASESGESPLIGLDGWYEDTSYANQGWDKSWKVVDRGGNHVAACDINATCPSTVVPMHAVQVSPGVVSVEVDYKRNIVTGIMPALIVTDANWKHFGYMYAYLGRGDLVEIKLPDIGKDFGNDHHGLDKFSDPGKWFGLKMVINTAKKQITGYIRSGSGEWVQLNKTPLPYHSPEAKGTQLFIGIGSYKHKAVDNNLLEMDNMRVTQLSVAE
ncbi:MAG: DUF4838 domain-containing protein [Armatimonadetes bacterium]|nr:DUF4838 domain-containing protein [Armatimonadota bacterium]